MSNILLNLTNLNDYELLSKLNKLYIGKEAEDIVFSLLKIFEQHGRALDLVFHFVGIYYIIYYLLSLLLLSFIYYFLFLFLFSYLFLIPILIIIDDEISKCADHIQLFRGEGNRILFILNNIYIYILNIYIPNSQF